MSQPSARTKKPRAANRLITRDRLIKMIEQATVDAYGEVEQAAGWLTMLEQHVGLPFETTVLGVTVKVVGFGLRNEMIIAILSRGRARQVIGLVDLPLPLRRAEGIEWIEAYRRFVQDSET